MFSDPSPAEVAELNRLGEEGWELVALTSRNGTTAYAVLKRPVEETSGPGAVERQDLQVMPW